MFHGWLKPVAKTWSVVCSHDKRGQCLAMLWKHVAQAGDGAKWKVLPDGETPFNGENKRNKEMSRRIFYAKGKA